jgi:hypothetical protein
MARRDIEPVNQGSSICREKIEPDRVLYKQGTGIERMSEHLKISRAIATRYDQRASSIMGIVHIISTRYWLKFVYASQPLEPDPAIPDSTSLFCPKCCFMASSASTGFRSRIAWAIRA